MRAPADVGEQARGVAQPPLLRGLVEAGRRHEAVGPGDQLLAVRGRARAQHIEFGAPRRSAGPALARRRPAASRAALRARRARRSRPPSAWPCAMMCSSTSARVGQQRPARIGDHFDLRQRLRCRRDAPAGEIQRLSRRDHVAVHHVQRIAASATCAAAPARARCRRRRRRCGPRRARACGAARAPRLTIFSAFLSDFAGSVLQRQAAERQGHAALRARCRARRSVRASRRRGRRRCRRAGGMPETTPSADSSRLALARRAPRSWCRQMRSACAMKAVPFLASRQAAVASTHSSRDLACVSHSARKRRSAASALSTASARQQAGRLHLAAEPGRAPFR